MYLPHRHASKVSYDDLSILSILSNYIHSIDPADNIMVVGDFNARTATLSASINICPYHPEDEDRLYDLVYTRLNEAYNVPQCSVSRIMIVVS